MPRICVLLPVRDAAGTLPECLASLSAQTLADHEVVAVDDGSRDATADVLARSAAADPRLRVVATGARGLVSALNHALMLARSPLVARMDADDVAHPERLRLQAERLERDSHTHVLGCRVRLRAPGARGSRGMRAYVEWSNALLDHEAMAEERWVESPVVHPSVAMRREELRALGGYRELDGPEDYDLWLRAFAAGLRFAKLPEVLLEWRDDPGRLTRADPRYAPARFRALKIEHLERGPLACRRPLVVWGAGPTGKTWARDLLRRGHILRAFVEVDARKLGARIHGAPVVPVAQASRFAGALHLAAVGQRGARRRIRAEATRLGIAPGDLVAVA